MAPTASLKSLAPEFARYKRTFQNDPKVKKIVYIAVLADRMLLSKSTVVTELSKGKRRSRYRNWKRKGFVPAGLTLQQYCAKLADEGYEME